MLLYLLITLPVAAQPDLPAPIFHGTGPLQRHQIVWSADSSTLYISFARSYEDVAIARDDLLASNIVLPDEAASYDMNTAAFAYDVESAVVSLVQPSPFLLLIDDNERELYQVAFGLIHRSPYIPAGENTPIFYLSNLLSYCGPECASLLVIAGQYDAQFYDLGSYAPLAIPVSTAIVDVLWSANSDYALVMATKQYSILRDVFHVTLADGAMLPVAEILDSGEAVFAIADDGQRVLYSQGGQLMLWRAPYNDVACRCTHWSETRVISEDAFSGATFIPGDVDHILAVSAAGIGRYNLTSGDYDIVTPNANNYEWAELAVFSPDHRQVAVTSGGSLFMLPATPDD